MPPDSNRPSQETTNALTEDHFKRLESKLGDLRKIHKEELDDLRKVHKEALDEIKSQLRDLLKDKERALLWGISAIGMAMTGLLGWLLTHAKDIVKW
jgi:hypothetical protein